MNEQRFQIIRKIFLMMLPLMIFLIWTESLWAASVRIAIIDSGAEDSVDQAISFSGIPATRDPLSHGTVVARLIRKNNPDAEIIMLQVCEARDGGWKPSPAAVTKAIEWSIANAVDVINMSLVTSYDKTLDERISQAASAGIIVIAAAGNNSLVNHFAVDSNGYIRKGLQTLPPVFPSSNPFVISVGALSQKTKDGRSLRHCDIYADGKVMGQEGSSFASARITAQVAQMLSQQTLRSKKEILTYLNGNGF